MGQKPFALLVILTLYIQISQAWVQWVAPAIALSGLLTGLHFHLNGDAVAIAIGDNI